MLPPSIPPARRKCPGRSELGAVALGGDGPARTKKGGRERGLVRRSGAGRVGQAGLRTDMLLAETGGALASGALASEGWTYVRNSTWW